MPKTNAVVSRVLRVEPPLDRAPAGIVRAGAEVFVELEGDRRVRLDPEDARSAGFVQVLDGLRKLNLPVYLELDPETSAIDRLLIPRVTRVAALRSLDEGLGVDLELSHGRHLLRREAPDFEELERELREAERSGELVVVTEDDAHEIVDVRTYRPGPEGPPRPFPELEPPTERRLLWPRLRWLLRIWRWPWWWFGCVSPRKAQQVFGAMSTTSCAPLTVPPPCIPFLYPDDGCWARAHEMCRLMIAMGLKPRKVWIQGGLHVSTRNNPSCNVSWGWHVAPTLCVRGRGIFGFFFGRERVIDPSLFTQPVSKATWKGVQGDPNATLTDSAAAIYYLWGSVTDPSYTETNHYLAYYRLQLQSRAIQHGPPPYAHCP